MNQQHADTSPSDGSLPARWMPACYFLLGFTAILAQSFLVREFFYVYEGNELNLGFVFGAWLLWIAVGAEIASHRVPRIQRPRIAFALGLALASFSLASQITLVRFGRVLLHLPAGEIPGVGHVVGLTVATLLPAALFPGALAPLALRLAGKERERDPQQVVRLYVWESAGSLAGGCLFSFVLVTLIGSVVAASLWMCLLLDAAAVALVKRDQAMTATRRLSVAFLLALFNCIIVAAGVTWEHTTVHRRWDSLNTGTRLLWCRDSRYENVSLSSEAQQCNIFNDGHYAFSIPDQNAGVLSTLILSQQPSPRRVLVIGDGLQDLVAQVLTTKVETVHWVYRDAMLTRWLHRYLSQETSRRLTDRRLSRFGTDARQYVYTTHEKYDVIYVATTDPSTALANRFYTREFFRQCIERLTPAGVMCIRLNMSEAYLGEEVGRMSATIFRTFDSTFQYSALSPEDTPLLFGSQQEGILTYDTGELYHRIESWLLPNTPTRILPKLVYSCYLPGRPEESLAQLQRYSEAPLNSDLHPTAYLEYVRVFDRLTGDHLRYLSRWLHRNKLLLILLGVLAVAAVCVRGHVARLKRERTDCTPLTAATVMGFTAMSLEMVILLYYQTKFGALYQMVGILVASFMVGLTVGGLAVKKIVDRPSRCKTIALALLIASAVFAWILPAVMGGLWELSGHISLVSGLFFPTLLLIAGGLTGSSLPVLVVLASPMQPDFPRVTARVNRADHLGGAIGAIAAGALLIPVWGVVTVCHVVALCCFGAAALLAGSRASTTVSIPD